MGVSRGSRRSGCSAVDSSKGGRQIIDFIRIHGKDMKIDWKGGNQSHVQRPGTGLVRAGIQCWIIG